MLKISELKNLNVSNYPEISVKTYRRNKKLGWCCEILFWLYRKTTNREKVSDNTLKTTKCDYMVKVVDNVHKVRNVEHNIEDNQAI